MFLGVAMPRKSQAILRLSGWIRIALLGACVIGAPQVNASDPNSSCPAAKEGSSSSSPHTDHIPNGCAGTKDTSARYDLNRIGERRIGKGINLYSSEKERSLGEAMAAAIDAQTISVRD